MDDGRDFFLCHSHKDKEFVRKLAIELSSLGVEAFLDEWELEPGDSLHGVIGEGLERSTYVGVVLSPDSIASRWCQDELREALAREKESGQKILIPLVLRDVKIPIFLLDRLYLDFREGFYRPLSLLVSCIVGIEPKKIQTVLAKAEPVSFADLLVVLGDCGYHPQPTPLPPLLDSAKNVSIFRHEMKSSLSFLASIPNQTEYILRSEGLTPPEGLPKRLCAYLKDIDSIVNNILFKFEVFTTKPQDVVGEVAPANFLSEVAVPVIGVLNSYATNRTLSIFPDTKSLDLLITCHPESCRMALYHLIENSIRFSDPNSEIKVFCQTSEEYNIVCVENWATNLPLSNDEVSKIFEKGYIGKKASQSLIGGAGLGLYFIREILRLNRAELKLIKWKDTICFGIFFKRADK